MQPVHNYSNAFLKFLIIATIALIIFAAVVPTPVKGQTRDSVKAKVLNTAENTLVFKVDGMKFISYNCKCDHLKKSDVFWIPKTRFDSLLLEAKPVRKRQVGN